MLSVNGKNPSDAQTKNLFLKYLFIFFNAKFSASTLLVCPWPNPRVCLLLERTIAFDFKCFATLREKIKSSIDFVEPFFFETNLLDLWSDLF